jgi:hypothetical protein
MDFKGFPCMSQQLVSPLVVLRWAALVLGANLGHRLALEAFKPDQGFGLGVPFSSVHG